MSEGNHANDNPGENRSWRPSLSLLKRFATLLDKTVFFCLLGLIVLAAIPYGTVEPWWEALFECAVFAITAIWILEALLRGGWETNRLPILLPLIIITVYAFAQTVEWPAAWLAIGNL